MTAAIGLVMSALVALTLPAGAPSMELVAHTTPTVVERSVGSYGFILTTGSGRSLYLLTTESSGTLHCTSSSCTSIWPPLLVAKGAHETKGSGVKGTLGHVVRGTKWQVTFNGWPVYRYLGDSGTGQTHGEHLFEFGGTWYLLHARTIYHSKTAIT